VASTSGTRNRRQYPQLEFVLVEEFPVNRHIVTAACVAVLCSSLACASTIDEAKQFLLRGDAVKGMEILENNLASHASDIEFNYLLGIASLDAGNPGNAVFAFERVLALDPNHPQARAELARALIALTEYDAARTELMQVRTMHPPPEVAAKIDWLLGELERAIAEHQKQQTTVWSGYVEGEIGYDTNINTAPNANSVFIPALGLPASLTGFSTAQKSGVLGLNAGVSVSHKIIDGTELFASINGRLRGHQQSAFFLSSASEVLGARFTSGKNQLSLGYTRFDQYITQYHNDAQDGLFGEWKHEVSGQDIVGAFGQYIEVRHPIVRFLDTNMIIGGGTWTHAFLGNGDPRLNFVAYYGDDKDIRNNPTLSRQLFGTSARGEYKLYDNVKLVGSLSAQHSDYKGQNIWFRTQRRDDRYDVALGATYKVDRVWSITPQFIYTRNQSSVTFNAFERNQFLLTARRDF
jgi:outer membrane protein